MCICEQVSTSFHKLTLQMGEAIIERDQEGETFVARVIASEFLEAGGGGW